MRRKAFIETKFIAILEKAVLHYESFRARGCCPSTGNSTFRISAGQSPGKSRLLRRTVGMSASLACMFARDVDIRTCVGYC